MLKKPAWPLGSLNGRGEDDKEAETSGEGSCEFPSYRRPNRVETVFGLFRERWSEKSVHHV